MQTADPQYWLRCNGEPLASRIWPAPDELIAYVALVAAIEHKPLVPTTAPGSDALVQDVSAAVAELPPSIQTRVDHPLLGIFLARGLGCSGIADVVRYGQHVLGVAVLLDLGVLEDRTANRWASWKESHSLAAGSAAPVRVQIEPASDDDRKNAIQFVLLHEFGHVLTAGRGFLPDWWTDPDALAAPGTYPYLGLSWTIDTHRQIVPNGEPQQALQRHLIHTRTTSSTDAGLLAAYAALDATNLPTLYAANNAYDDLAEVFAVYVHTVLMGRPFEVSIEGRQGWVAVSGAASIARRCAQKYQFIAQRLRLPGPRIAATRLASH